MTAYKAAPKVAIANPYEYTNWARVYAGCGGDAPIPRPVLITVANPGPPDDRGIYPNGPWARWSDQDGRMFWHCVVDHERVMERARMQRYKDLPSKTNEPVQEDRARKDLE